LFLRFAYVPAPFSIYDGIRKVPPASIIRFPLQTLTETPETIRYWFAEDVAAAGHSDPFHGTVEEALARLDELLLDSVRLRMVADVPVGAFLSGGIDSSLVTSAMQRAGASPAKTFSIGFGDRHFNEAPYAAAVARHLGTDHTEAYVSPADAMAIIPQLPPMYDEPFGDSSQIPTFFVARLARQSVTVCLSGDGGDELFGGYTRYVWGLRRWRAIRMLPKPARHALAAALERVPAERWDRWIAASSAFGSRLGSSPGEKVHKLARVLRANSPERIYEMLVTFWHRGSPVAVPDPIDSRLAFIDAATNSRLTDFASQMMFLDLISYLPDDILVKVDRATMAVSLEGRVPLLDPRIIEFAFRLPMSWKIRGMTGKWLLRHLLYKYVPRKLVHRPKMGFGIPLGSWLRGPLRDWAESLLAVPRLQREGYLDAAPIRARWSDLLAARGTPHFDLWNVLMFEAWLDASSARTPLASASMMAGDCAVSVPP
jgi:asparagine synthase (glutamine-hydrolysing)